MKHGKVTAFACSAPSNMQFKILKFEVALLGVVLGTNSTELPSRLFTGLPAQPHDTAEFWLRVSPLQMHTLTPVPFGLQDFLPWS